MLVFLNRLIEWEFDELRRKKSYDRTSSKAKAKKTQEMLDEKLFLHKLGVNDYSEFINVHIPLFPEVVPEEVLEMYGIIRKVVEVAGNGHSIGVRGSMNDIEQQIERKGYMAVPFIPYLKKYENALISFYNKESK